MIGQQRKKPYLPLFFAAVCAASSLTGYGQALAPSQPANRNLILAEEQFRQEHYSLAAQSARLFLAEKQDKVQAESSKITEKAKYLVTVSDIKTNEPGCMARADEMIGTTQNKAYEQRICFTIAQHYFKHNLLAKAIPYYERAGIDNLTNSEVADSKFEMAYCYFNNKQFDKAAPLFSSIKELKGGKYYDAGNYYYGLLAYNQNNYKEAITSFERIRDVKDYRSTVPYYIAEIYYFMGDRDKALQEAKAIIAGRDKSYYDNDVHMLAAQCLFDVQKYAEARPYFEYYYDHTNKIKKEDLYKIGYCYYRLNDWKNATEKFKLLSNESDSLGQSSMYLLGDCYLKTGERQSARNAFGICADLDFNPGQQEASMMLYARLSYEEGYNDAAVEQLRILLKAFPASQYTDEANTLLSGLLLATNDFAGALKYLDVVTTKDKGYWQFYQKANYGYAVQLFRKGELANAYTYFGNSVSHPMDVNYEAAAYFWRGELAYRQHKYADAVSNSQEFINRKADKAILAGISPQATVQHAYMNMGFAAMEGQNYAGAQTYFNKAQQANGEDGYSGMVASLREADAVFMQQNYVKAIALYDKIINTDTANADYARYQKSIILGLQGKNGDKVKVLQSLVTGTPPSVYAITARYEIAVTYIEMDKYPQALSYLQYITDSAADRSAVPKAWMKIGFIYQQTNENAKAIAAYKSVVTGFPASDERVAALDALRSLYIQGNQPASYAQLLKDNNLPVAENTSLDSTYYAAAEGQFATGKWDNALRSLSGYLKEYPNGVFAIKAHYYKGECNYQLKKNKEAQEDFDVVLATAWNDFSENSARHAAAIAMDSKEYAAAYGYYLKMRNNTRTNPQATQAALEGLIKSGFNAGKYEQAGLYADSLLATPGLSGDMINDALLYKAKANQQFNKPDAAIALYKQLSENKTGEIAAESRYHIAEILVAQDSLKDGEEAAGETIRLSPGYDYWIVKSYILLSDIFVKQKDYFNAKATLNSIVKRVKITELKQEATKKLAEVKALEKHQSKLKED